MQDRIHEAARHYRLRRVREQLMAAGCEAILLYDPVNIRYATDTTNMQVWTMHNPARYALVLAEGPNLLWEFHNCAHLHAGNTVLDEIRQAVNWSYFACGDRAGERAKVWAGELSAELRRQCGKAPILAVDTAARHGLAIGVTMSSSRVVSGTPASTGSGTATVTARDSDGDTASISFNWSVAADLKPAFAAATLTKRNWNEGQAITAFTMPAASGGDGTLTYAATGLPSGVSMSSSRSVSGTPANSGSGIAIVTAADADGDTATIRFPWAVSPEADDLTPTFGSDSIVNRDWIVSQSISSFTAPAATGDDGTLTYAAEGLPDGVTMSPARVVSGSPTATGFGTARITAQDADGDFATLAFHWSVTTSASNGLIADPNPSADGSYSVSGAMTTPDPNSYLTYQMIETEPGGGKNTHSVADPSNISLSFSGKSAGTYIYQVQRCDYYSTSTLSGFVCTDIGSPLSVKVAMRAPVSLMGPDTDTDGAYTITWSAVSGATRYELQHSRNGGPWSDTPVTGTPTSKAFTVAESGEYQYRIRACDATRCSGWTAIKMILVNLPPAVGFDSKYVVRTGDLGSDGDTDIYLSPLATGTGNVGEFILRNDKGTIALETGPSAAQLASAQTWAVSTQLEIALEDVDVDGVWDAYVSGIAGAPSTAKFKGAVDQIVVSPTSSGAGPTGLVTVDADLKSFIESVMAWYSDTTHFDVTLAAGTKYFYGGAFAPNAIPVYRAGCYAQFGYCNEYVGLMSDFFGSEALCVTTLLSQGHLDARIGCNTSGTHFYVTLAASLTRRDISNVSLEVAKFVTIWEAGESRFQVEDLADVLEDVLGITIGGYDFSGIGNEDLDDSIEQRIFEVHQSLLNIYALIGAQGRGNLDIPANKVLVTKRRVVLPRLGLGKRWSWGIDWADENDWHAALEYPLVETYNELSHNPTIAAYQRSDKLVSERNHISERNNLFAGTVTSSALANMATIWIALVDKERNYCNDLDYAFPSTSPPEQDEYNSNGFAAGIIASIVATTDAPIRTFYLGNRPLPSSEFLPSECE